jgi:predicted dehydrogenase
VQPPKPHQRIGLVDYQLDNFHANTFLPLLHGPLAERGYRIAGATALRREESSAWAHQRNIPWYETIRELDEQVDCFMILAPSNPECHLGLCEQVFPCGKTTFVDKTFAPDLSTALQLFALADQYCIAVQSSSALRYTAVQQAIRALDEPVQHLYVWAGGTTFDEYAIHPVELIVSCLGANATEIVRVGAASHPQLLLQFQGDRSAVIDFTAGADVPYAAAITTARTTEFLMLDLADLFRDALSAVLDFFDAGVPQFDRAETLLVRNILDVALRPAADHQFYRFVSPEVSRPPAA